MTGFFEGTGGAATPVPHDLNTHTDVTIADPVDGQVIIYQASTETWINVPDTAGATPDLSLEELNNVTDTPPTDGQLLQWSDSGQEWINGAASGVSLNLEELLDVTITTPAANDTLIYQGGEWINQSTGTTASNPVTVGDGADVTNAGVILDAGTADGDLAYIDFKAGGVTKFSIGSTADTGENIFSSGVVSQYEDDRVWIESTNIYFGPDGPDTGVYDFFMNGTLGVVGDIVTFGNCNAIAMAMNSGENDQLLDFFVSPPKTIVNKEYADALHALTVRTTGNQAVGGEKTFTSPMFAANELTVTGICKADTLGATNLTIAGRGLEVGAFGAIVMSASARSLTEVNDELEALKAQLTLLGVI
jgi:hypothetical protein